MADVRLLLTDKEIARLPTPRKGWYLARDTELKGFFVVVGKRKRTFTVQGDLREDGKRATSIRSQSATSKNSRQGRPERLPRNILLR